MMMIETARKINFKCILVLSLVSLIWAKSVKTVEKNDDGEFFLSHALNTQPSSEMLNVESSSKSDALINERKELLDDELINSNSSSDQEQEPERDEAAYHKIANMLQRFSKVANQQKRGLRLRKYYDYNKLFVFFIFQLNQKHRRMQNVHFILCWRVFGPNADFYDLMFVLCIDLSHSNL